MYHKATQSKSNAAITSGMNYGGMGWHNETTSFQIYWKFYLKKLKKSDKKNSDIFYVSAQNIDCGYSLEPPRRGGSNEIPQSMFRAEIRKIIFTPVNPSFTI